MKKLKMGTPAMGIVIGLSLVGVAALIMLIGFWKTLVLVALFAVGFFVGTVENKQKFIKDTVNRIIPAKDTKVIDFKSEITRESEERKTEMQVPAVTEENNEDGE